MLFTVTRQEPRLVVPVEPTPYELKQLSDIDDQEGLRFQIPVIMFYKSNPLMEGEDPVRVIREGLAKALLFYYPFAGRLVEGPNRKLLVDCTSEGVLFVEADAEVELNRLGDAILPGSPVLKELLHDVPGSDGILGCPLLLLQVTRFSCGGFAIALRLNHTMSDGAGLVQFLSAIAEFAQGKEVTAPSVSPVFPGLIVPHGYYDNVITYPAAVSKAGKVCSFPLEYTVELVKMAKSQMTAEYFRSVADLMVIKGRPLYTVAGNFIVSDARRLGLDTVDFGWGKPVYGGTARAFPMISFYMNFKDGIVVPICLPEPVMERFEEELKKMT
ncbi:hypothetical protein RHGRI_031222 [Rhododendron griersonianum]|uniref:Uncharacterized protein n=1 Tax=Rhododendron griersonianum TaxID=479676 RepID=A0AAV6I9K6_9ERIC|nr:hypothetical protein RHGRI_031222 [Rhododendron griersonianum]